MMYACCASVHRLLVNQYSSTPSGKLNSSPEASTPTGNTYSINFCIVAAAAVGLDRRVRSRQQLGGHRRARADESSGRITTRVELTSPPSLVMAGLPSRNDAASGAPNSLDLARPTPSRTALNVYSVSWW